MEKRVVVTGMGVVTPVGNNVETFWKNIVNGVCGIDYITQFPTDGLSVKIAGEVKDFKPADYGIAQGGQEVRPFQPLRSRRSQPGRGHERTQVYR